MMRPPSEMSVDEILNELVESITPDGLDALLRESEEPSQPPPQPNPDQPDLPFDS